MGKLWRSDPQSRLDWKEARVELPRIPLSSSPTRTRRVTGEDGELVCRSLDLEAASPKATSFEEVPEQKRLRSRSKNTAHTFQ